MSFRTLISVLLAAWPTAALMAQLPPGKPAGPAPAPEPPGLIARFGAAFFRHDANATAIAFSNDGKQMAVVTQDSRIRIWDPANAKEIRMLPQPVQGGSFLRLAFSKDGKELHALGHTATVRTWNIETGAESGGAATQPRYYVANAVGWAPEVDLALASDSTGTLRLINTKERTEIRNWKGHQFQAMAVALSPDGKLGASIGQENRPILWDVNTGKEARAREPSALQRNFASTSTFVFSPDGKHLVQGSYDRTVPVWETATGKIVRRLEVPMNVNGAFSVTFSPDGKYLAARMTDRTIRVWGLASGLELRCFDASGNHYEPLSFSHDSQLLAAGHGASVRLWELRSARERFPSEGHSGVVSGLLFLDGGKLLASTASDGTLRVWDIAQKKELARTGAQTTFLNPITPSQDAQSMELFGYNSSMVLRVSENRLIAEEMRQFVSGGSIRAVSPDGRWLAMTPNQALALLDAKTGRQTRTLATFRGYMQVLQFSPDGRLLAAWIQATGNEPQALRIWDAASGRELPQRLPEGVRNAPLRSMAFSRNGQLLALLDYNNMLHVVETATGIVRHSFPTPPESPLANLAFNGDGSTLFLGLSNGQLLVRNLVHGTQTGPFRAHASMIQVLALSRDGKQLATGGADSTIMLCSTDALQPKRPQALAVQAADHDRFWADLGSSDGVRVSLALWALQNHAAAAIALVRERFQPDAPPPAPPSAEQLAKWVVDLDDERFPVREKAHRALANAGEAARPVYQAAMDKNPSDEVRRRITTLIRALSGPLPPAKLRPYRILELLERIGSPEARQLLTDLAKKATDPEFRAEALRIADRLNGKER